MVDVAVKNGPAWLCRGQLPSILLSVDLDDDLKDLALTEGDASSRPVLLEQTAEGSPCILAVRCDPPTAISSLLVVSEARTIEVYSQNGDYCGTGRGARDDGVQTDGTDRGPFYKKQLILDQPTTSCEVKLLSLGGRNSVLVSRIVLGLQPQDPRVPVGPPGPGPGSSIDMQRVQSLVEEMGTGLSPGAQNLMDMVQYQQKNQTSSLGGLLPLLMGGGALSALARGANGPQPAAFKPPASSRPADEAPAAQNGALQSDESHSSSPEPPPANVANSKSAGPLSHAQLAEMMSHFLNGQTPGQGCGQVLSSTPAFLPMLQSVCGQVTQLRLDGAAAEKEQKLTNGAWELDQAMDRRLEEMEQRLKQHIDRRLDALEQRLQTALLSVLPPLALHPGTTGTTTTPTGGGAAPTGDSEETK
ncbi:ATPase PAAT [Diretmus argenteus]